MREVQFSSERPVVNMERPAREVRVRAPRSRCGGVPPDFRNKCIVARRGRANGYIDAGRCLVRHLFVQVPRAVARDERESDLERLRDLLETGDAAGAWRWLRERYPKCMDLVPAERRHEFIEGALTAILEGGE
jgi:hypothetical protein